MAKCTGKVVASYFGPGPPANRELVRFSRSFLKINCTIEDVETQGFDASGNPDAVRRAKNVLMSSGTQVEVRAGTMANFATVKGRIKCVDDQFSEWITVAK